MTVTRTDFSDEALRSWWNDAYRNHRLVRDTLFQSFAWNKLWNENYVSGDARRELVLLKVEDAGRIVAAAPFFMQSRSAGPLTAWRYLLFLADRLAQYTDLITESSDAGAVWSAVLEYVGREFPAAWITLHDVLPESTAGRADLEADREQGEAYLRLPLAELDEESLVPHCALHMQREIQRARRTYDREEALRWEAVPHPSSGLVEKLIELNRHRFGEKSWFADPVNREFFMTLCRDSAHEIVFSVLYHDEDIAHIMASYVHGNSMLYVLSGLNEEYKRYSPGSMNLDQSIRYAMHSGLEYFDFLRGDETYKQEFNPEQRHSEHWTLHPSGKSMRYGLAKKAQQIVQKHERKRAS